MAALEASGGRRVFIEDVRGNDAFLRATWHPETRVVVISHWSGELCTAATPIPIDEASTLIGLLVNALQEAVVPAVPAAVAPASEKLRTGLLTRITSWIRPCIAEVLDLGRYRVHRAGGRRRDRSA